MVVGYLVLLMLIIVGLRFGKTAEGDSFVDNAHCMPIKGICIASVFLGHAGGYLYMSGPDGLYGLERVFYFLNDNFGQLKVVPFLFFSGYGVARCLEAKKDTYLDSMPRHRILRTLLRFDIAILCFVGLNLLLGIPMTLRQVGLSFIGWDSIGNSNWYIFIILVCYASTWLAGLVGRARSISAGGTCGLLWFILLAVMFVLTFCRDSYWYNTMLAYPAGALYALHRSRVNQVFHDHFWISALCLSLLTTGIHVFTHFVGLPGGDIWYNLKGISFAFLVVCLMTRIELRSRALSWMGENLFEIYIYQRIPMVAMMTLASGACLEHREIFVACASMLTFVIVFLIAYGRKLQKGEGDGQRK